jgi:hypothetical protein
MRQFLVVFTAGLGLCGCAGLTGAPHQLTSPTAVGATLLVVDGISVINTQKTIDDHLVSLLTGEDCSTVRASMGDHYCVEEPVPVPMIARTSYCYKTLAKISCFDQPIAQDTPVFYGTRVDNVPVTVR